MARNPNHLDLFVTGTDGRHLLDAGGTPNVGWAGWFNVSGGTRGARARRSRRSPATRTTSTCSSPAPTAGSTRPGGTPSGGWAGWFNVSGGAAALGSPITAIARNPNHLDLFVTGTDGRIYSTWWDADGGWADWFNVSGGAAAPGSRINVVARNPNHLDLFVTGTDGRIYSTWWDASGGWANWFNVSGGAAALASPIDVVARYPDHLDLFVTGTDGRIYSTWWHQTEALRVHVKMLSEPTSVTRAQMIQIMQDVYPDRRDRRRRRQRRSRSTCPLLNDLDVGACTVGSTTAEQNQLFANRNNAAPTTCASTSSARRCRRSTGALPTRPTAWAAVVTSVASPWTMGHECGHVLGLPHVAPTRPADDGRRHLEHHQPAA